MQKEIIDSRSTACSLALLSSEAVRAAKTGEMLEQSKAALANIKKAEFYLYLKPLNT